MSDNANLELQNLGQPTYEVLMMHLAQLTAKIDVLEQQLSLPPEGMAGQLSLGAPNPNMQRELRELPTFPVGSAIPWFASAADGGVPPDGWLICNGAAYLRADYPALFAAIGTLYDLSFINASYAITADYFRVPDCYNRVVMGGGWFNVAGAWNAGFGANYAYGPLGSRFGSSQPLTTGTALPGIGQTVTIASNPLDDDFGTGLTIWPPIITASWIIKT